MSRSNAITVAIIGLAQQRMRITLKCSQQQVRAVGGLRYERRVFDVEHGGKDTIATILETTLEQTS